MAIKYSWYYTMWKLKAWTGNRKPDAPAISNDNFNADDDGSFDEFDSNFNDNPNTDTNADVTDGYIGFGVHLQTALYEDASIRKVLRVFQFTELDRKFSGSTKFQLNNFKEAEAIGAFKQASVTLKASNEANLYPYFGKQHTTTFVLSNCAILSEISAFFRDKEVLVGPDKVPYKVVPNTFQIKPSKARSQVVA